MMKYQQEDKKETNEIIKRLKKKNPEEKIQILKEEICLFLKDDAERIKYIKELDWEKKKDIIHWGQRKLFISEVWFLTKYGELGKTVVYAGSAPGTHIPFLSHLFPSHYFILVDPSDFSLKDLPFDQTVKNRMEVKQQYFTDELAEELGRKYQDILFISDIRTANHQEQDQEMVEIMVLKDNLKQRDWVKLLNAKKSLLKFRCPYPDRKNGKQNLRMLKGEIYLQPWIGHSSTETRLIPDDSLEEIEYDNEKYEEQLAYHNKIVRRRKYNQPIPDGEGFNDSWDVSAEILILYDFLKKFPQFYPELSDIFEKIKQFSFDISRNISLTARNLATPMLHPDKRRRFVPKDHTSFYPDLKEIEKN